jgi:hypothetical protein
MCGTKNAVAIKLLDGDAVLESHDHCPGNANGAERFVSLV